MADSNSNSSSSSNHSASTTRPPNRRKISGGSKQSSPQYRTSESDSLWQRKWLSNCDSIFGGHRSDLYDSVDDDREMAAKAVAIVVNSTRKGVVSLCAEVAGLLKAKKRLELALAVQKNGLPSHVGTSPSDNCHRLSSSSGSGSSISSKDKDPNPTKPSQKSLLHTSTNMISTHASCNSRHISIQTEQSSFTSPRPGHDTNQPTDNKPRPLSRRYSHEKAKQDISSMETLQDELSKALARNVKLEEELSAAKAELQVLKEKSALPKLYKLSHGNKTVTVNTEQPLIIRSTQSSPGHLETLNQDREFPHIVNKHEPGQAHHEANCNLKSCVKHRNNKVGLRPFSSPYKIYPSPTADRPLSHKAASLTNGECYTLPTSVSPSENIFNTDKKLQFTKTEVLPKLGDHVVVQGELRGIVKHIGPIKGELQTYVGLHLDSPVGNNNGTLNGVRYFSCPPHYGAFVPIEDVVSVLTKKNTAKECISVNRLHVKPRREVQPLSSCERSSSASPLPKSPVERQSVETAA